MARNLATCNRTDTVLATPADAWTDIVVGKRVAYAVLFAVCAGVGLLVSRVAWSGTMNRETVVVASTTGRTEFSTEVALSIAEHEQGLMFRTSIGDREAMLFVYPKPLTIQMWMHNTYVPLDMVFMRADGTVLRIEANAEPLSDHVISSGGAASGVLELKGGTAGLIGLKPGDHIEAPSMRAAAP